MSIYIISPCQCTLFPVSVHIPSLCKFTSLPFVNVHPFPFKCTFLPLVSVHPFPVQYVSLPQVSVQPFLMLVYKKIHTLLIAVYIFSPCECTSLPHASVHPFPVSTYIPSPYRYTPLYNVFFKIIFWGIWFDIFSYYIQHYFIYRPSDSTVPTDAGIKPRTIATSALAVRCSNH